MIIVIVILSILVALLGYLLYVNYHRAERATDYCETYVRFVSAIYFRFLETRDNMKQLDRLGAFQADDEVGAIFKDMDESIDNLYAFITKYVNREETEKDKKTKN